MKKRIAKLIVTIAALAFGDLSLAHAQQLEVKACTLGKLEARCGTLMVEENRSHPGKKIPIYFVIAPALGEHKSKDPMVQLQGGPGVAGTPAAEDQAKTFAWVRKTRDLVIVDQRGTGRSNPLVCGAEDAALTLQQGLSDLSDEARTCLEKLKDKADLTAYHAGESVEDLDELRRALGYEKINLFGISYGSRLALQYARRHGEAVRTLILEGPLPPDASALPLEFPRNAQDALHGVMAACAEDKECHASYPDVEGDLRKALARFAHGPITVTAEHPVSHATQTANLRRETFTEILRGYLATSEDAVKLPRMIHNAAQGDLKEWAVRAFRNRLNTPGFSFGMWLSSTCAEDLPYANDAKAVALDEKTIFGTYRLQQQRKACAMWPRGKMPGDFRWPLGSDIPVLFSVGELDYVTPPRYSQRMAASMRNSKVALFPHGAHLLDVNFACVDKIEEQMLLTASAKEVDASCTAESKLPKFAK